MDFLECISGRRSVRKFTTEQVEHGILGEIVHGASYSPSWKNTQTVRYVAVEDKETINRIADECFMGFESNISTAKNSPMLVIVTTITNRCGYERDGSFTTNKGDRWEMFDAGIAAQSFCLTAHHYGLGTVIMGIFEDNKIGESINLPENQTVAAVIALGHPAESPDMPKRKSVEDLLSYK